MSFRDIKGQDKPIEILRSHIKQSRLGNSYLFAGPDGVGKNIVARTLAKALNCQQEALDSCDKCPSCLKIEKNQHPDIHFLDTKDSDTIKIENIRQLQKDINLRPYEAKRKVFIIDNAHNLTAEASGALLKILEEPPADSLIILVTSKPQLLFKTIISRCRILRFSPLKRTVLSEILKKDYGLDNNNSSFLAYFCEGRIGQALRMKEADILRGKNKIIDAFINKKSTDLENLSIRGKEDARRYLNILATWLRDIYMIKVGIPHSELINFDRKEELLRLINRYSFAELEDMLGSIADSLLYLEENINIKLLLSNLMCHINN